MSDEVKIGFELHTIQIPLGDLLPLRQIKEPGKITRYKAIFVSIKEVGLIEPLMVFCFALGVGQRGKQEHAYEHSRQRAHPGVIET